MEVAASVSGASDEGGIFISCASCRHPRFSHTHPPTLISLLTFHPVVNTCIRLHTRPRYCQEFVQEPKKCKVCLTVRMRLENEHRRRNVSRDGETETTDSPGMDRSAEGEDRTWMTEASLLSLPHPIESTCVGIPPQIYIFSYFPDKVAVRRRRWRVG